MTVPAQVAMRLFTANGVEVFVPLAPDTDFAALFALAQAASVKAVAAGWHSGPPAGLASGEQQEPVGWVVRTTKPGRTGVAQVVDLYSTNAGWVKPFLKVYLNTGADVLEFERLSGLTVTDLPEYEGEGRLERGKSPKTDRYITAVRKPFAAVFIPNPRYDEDEAKAVKAKGDAYPIPKRKFLRWASAPAPAGSPPAPQATGSRPSAGPPADGGQRGAGQPQPQRRDEPQTPAWLVNEYRFCQDEEQFAYLETVRNRLWPAATAPGERTNMKAASDECRKRLAEEVVPF